VRDDIDAFDDIGERPKIVGVSLHATGHLYNHLIGNLTLKRGDRVLIDSEAGTCFGTVETEPHPAALTLDLSRVKTIIRLVSDQDRVVEEENRQREAAARRLCLEKIFHFRLNMKLVNADYMHDGRKVVFYFVAEDRVDFRELVRDLANTLHVRIEMKQIGARDEAKVTGGVGPCGRELCCSSWLRDFEAVTVKMAREQGLALNPSRLAGMCGRLKCCLRYEYATYVELKRSLPPIGRKVECVRGDGKVLRHNVLKQTVLIQRDEDGGVVEVTLEELVEKRPE
jgi:cell fate regulator YaaT (PSP1 superfamily)